MITVPNRRIMTLIIKSNKEPELIDGFARRERNSVQAISPKGVIIWIDKQIRQEFKDEFTVKNGVFIKHNKSSHGENVYSIYAPDEWYDFVLVFLEGFQSINFKLNNMSLRKGLGQKVPGDFVINLKRGASCYFEIASVAYILQVTENKMSILSLRTGKIVSEC